MQRFDDYLEAEEKLWADTNESNLEFLKTLCGKEKYEKALREKVRAKAAVFRRYLCCNILPWFRRPLPASVAEFENMLSWIVRWRHSERHYQVFGFRQRILSLRSQC